MLGNPPFHRGAKKMRMKENGEKKMENFFVDFMINCPAICSLAQRQVIGSPSLWPPPHTYATSAYDSLESLWRWKGAPPKYTFLVLYQHTFHLTSRFCFPIKKIPPKVSNQTQHLQATTPRWHGKTWLCARYQHRGVQPGPKVFMYVWWLCPALWLCYWGNLLAEIWADTSKTRRGWVRASCCMMLV